MSFFAAVKMVLLLLFLVGCNTQEVPPAAPSPVEGVIVEPIEIPLNVEFQCNNVCIAVDSATRYTLTYNYSSETFDCSCLDSADAVIAHSLLYSDENLLQDNYDGEELHWTHMPVSFYVEEEICGDYEFNKIKKAFNKIADATDGVVSFKNVGLPDKADIVVNCSFIEDCYSKRIDIRKEEGVTYHYESICAHKRGVAQITRSFKNKIISAEIEMIGLAGFAETSGRGASGFYVGSCGHVTTEVHEILHTFGFGHSENPESVMYYAEDGVGLTVKKEGECLGSDKEVDADIVKTLIGIYGS